MKMKRSERQARSHDLNLRAHGLTLYLDRYLCLLFSRCTILELYPLFLTILLCVYILYFIYS